VVFTLTYSNLGAAAASGVVITADIPVSSTFSSASSAPTVWSCANGTGTGTLCTTAIGDLAAGASGTARFAVTMTATTRLYQVSTIQDDLSHGPDPDVTNNGVAFVNSQTYKSINLGPTRAPANISHVLVPSFYDGTQELPLLLLLHGLGSASYGVTYDATYDFRFSRGVNTRGYFLLLAKGTGMVRANVASEPYSAARPNAHWNATDTCCTPGGTGFQLTPATDVDDAAYLRGLIEQAIDTLNVDTRRIYASGYSNGAFMAYRLACEMPELITAIAPLAGATFQNEALCVGGEPVSVLHIHGTADAATRFYDYNYDHDNNPQTAVIMDAPNEPGAIQTIQRWAAKAGCDTSAGALVTGANINLLHPHNRTNPSTPVYVIGNGAETITRRYGANCQPGYAVELWEMVDQDHSTNFEYEAALLNGEPFPSERILDWLFARVRP
jgi:polyhydroxybutyrate depolymerase